MKKVITILAAIIVIIFIIRAPIFLDGISGKEWHNKSYELTKSDWKGKISIYNCYENSELESSWLNKTVSKFEKANKGIYIDVKNVSIQTIKDLRNGTGIKADIIIYPAMYDDLFTTNFSFSLPKPPKEATIVEDFEFDVDELEGGRTPAPILMNDFGIMVNQGENGKKRDYIHDFIIFISQQAHDMLE